MVGRREFFLICIKFQYPPLKVCHPILDNLLHVLTVWTIRLRFTLDEVLEIWINGYDQALIFSFSIFAYLKYQRTFTVGKNLRFVTNN